jgi:hypothetical protein
VRLVIVHTAEGALTYQSLGSFFSSGSAGVSSHTGIDDTPGRIGEYVKRGNKAWTAGDANPYSVNVELCGFASWSPAEWERHPTMLDNCARWIAEECRHYGIPIVKLGANEATHGGRGVCGHVDVSGPGGHWDPGPSFPWSKVIHAAAHGGPVYGQAPAAEQLLGRPIAHTGTGDDSMPAEYILHDTSDGFPGSGNFYAMFPSGLVRRVVEAERSAMAESGDGPPIRHVDLSKESSNLYHAYDQALRGIVSEK